MNILIKLVEPSLAEKICRAITADLPEYFGIPEANERYAHGMLDRISFVAYIDDRSVGMLTLENFYPNNANIYWMGVQKDFQGKNIGTKLLRFAENYCREHGFTSLTVETLSPKQADLNYLKTYRFYEKCGFKSLFEMNTYGPENLMVYMQKTLSFTDYDIIDLTHSLSSNIPHWGMDCGFEHKITLDYAGCTTTTKFRVQRLAMVAGIGTHMDAPAHCIPGGATIDAISLSQFIAPCVVIDVSDKAHENYSVITDDILKFEDEYGTIGQNTLVLIYTGWEKFWQEPKRYRNNLVFPCVSTQAAELLLERNIVGLGIDTLSPDRQGSDFPVHQLILGAGKYIIENIANASSLPCVGSLIFALPIKVKEGTEAPVRLIGLKMKD